MFFEIVRVMHMHIAWISRHTILRRLIYLDLYNLSSRASTSLRRECSDLHPEHSLGLFYPIQQLLDLLLALMYQYNEPTA